ncbi:hypothetical protein [[Clostridium] fimetarium]|uniref:Uncharacterized protein n=1 Tax=[Clostridium] fimetarium TaxID=99656 RepID=A0A1I0QUX2_9FIRM|nr:hypothetical protein [[Clostridium] fimetarium]SEW31448.1 hypothetical protein SAMN05421659_109149 [[Clostridium] fimetarium]
MRDIEIELHDLFNKWEKEQLKAENVKDFWRDGFTGYKTPENGYKYIFILKEAHTDFLKEESKEEQNKCNSWIKHFINSDKIKGNYRMLSILCNFVKFIMYYNITHNDNYVDYKISEQSKLLNTEVISKVAYMNINKMGGGSSSNDNEIIEYAKKYTDNIKSEIEILSEKSDNEKTYIFIAGKNKRTKYFEQIERLLNLDMNKYEVINIHHPSCSFKYTDNIRYYTEI